MRLFSPEEQQPSKVVFSADIKSTNRIGDKPG